ncbi:MAG: hypothetical protein HQ570_01200 [Candidatus Omnitrophica bacterium]|nr:hypothetical protein [Candidatus Omnitrophota bacterium]
MRKGISLVEVLLGAVILTFVFVAVLALFANCFIANEYNRNLTIALSRAQFVMEEMRGEVEDKTSLSSLRTKIEESDTTCCYNSTSAAWCCPSILTCSCPDEDPLRVRVTSSWVDQRGKTRDISLETLITVP